MLQMAFGLKDLGTLLWHLTELLIDGSMNQAMDQSLVTRIANGLADPRIANGLADPRPAFHCYLLV